MTTTVTAKIQLRKGTAAAWTSANPVLLSGEVGFETDTLKLKIGDGTTAWTALAYYHDPDLAATYAAVAHTHTGVYEPADATLLKQADIDDTPVNGATTVPVSSNWAYDHAALTTTHGISSFGASLVDDADASAARTTLGLGTSATTASTDYAPVGHTHSGVYDPAGTAASAVSAHAGGSGVHAIASVTGLQTALDGKSATTHDHSGTYAPVANGVTNGDSHDHSGGDGGQIAYSGLSGLPTLGTAASQNTTAFEAAGAVSTHAALTTTHGISAFGASLVDDADASAARTTLGLGTAATTASTDYAAASHNHAASAITSGTVDTARLGSGSASASTYLRGDQTWATASGGVAADTHAAAEKTTPVDADELPLADSAASWALKKLSWVNLKTTLSGVFALLAGKSGGQTLIGGTGVTDKLTLQGTSGNGTVTSTALEFKVGNNGSTNALTILNDGKIGINKTEPIYYQFSVSRGATAGIVSTFESSGSYTAVQIISGSGAVNLVGAGSSLAIQCASTEVMRINHVNNSVGIGISTPSAKLHSLATTEQLRLGYDASNYASFTVGSAGTLMITPSNNKIILGSTRTPASASATGAAGEVCWDSDYIYVCTASNTWKRAALSTW